MIITHWLRCTKCNALLPDVQMQSRDYPDNLPPCYACHGPTKVSWEHGEAPVYNAFTPLQVAEGKVIEDKSSLDRLTAAVKQKWGDNYRVELTPDSPKQRKQRADEIRQSARDYRKERGVPEDALPAHRELRIAAEAAASAQALKANQDPQAAAAKAAAALPSPSDLAAVKPPSKPLLAGASVVLSKPPAE